VYTSLPRKERKSKPPVWKKKASWPRLSGSKKKEVPKEQGEKGEKSAYDLVGGRRVFLSKSKRKKGSGSRNEPQERTRKTRMKRKRGGKESSFFPRKGRRKTFSNKTSVRKKGKKSFASPWPP